MFGGGKPPTPTPPPPPPQFGQDLSKSGDAYLRAQRGGLASTIMTSPQGANTGPTTKKTLLGQ